MSSHLDKPWDEPRPAPLFSNWVVGLGLFVLLLGVGAAIFVAASAANRAASLAAVTAVESRLTLEPDNGQQLTSLNRQSNSEVWYRVTLNEAPVGKRLDLRCDWIDPAGQLVHRNRYQTRVIDKKLWPTHARYRIGPGSPVGMWTVQLAIQDRVLATATLEVRDGEKTATPQWEIDDGKGGGS